MILNDGERELLRWAVDLDTDGGDVERLTAALMGDGQTTTSARHQRSTLNNDGSPLQVCVTALESRRVVRLIIDPCSGVDASARFSGLAGALTRVLPAVGASSLRPAVDQVLEAMLPQSRDDSALDAGLCWLAAGLGGAAVYVNTNWGRAQDRWDDASQWLRSVLPRDDIARRVLDALRRHSVLVSVGLEGRTPRDARPKCYWRLIRPISIGAMGHPMFESAVFAEFFHLLGADERLPLSGLVWSTGFSVTDGAARDVKVDVCGHCLTRSPDAWSHIVERCCYENHAAALPLADGLARRRGEVAFLGLGVTTGGGERRVNVYLKAPTPCS